MMLLASPVTDKVPELTKSPLVALVGSCSLGKTSTNSLLLNHFSDKVNSLRLNSIIAIKNLSDFLAIFGAEKRTFLAF